MLTKALGGKFSMAIAILLLSVVLFFTFAPQGADASHFQFGVCFYSFYFPPFLALKLLEFIAMVL
jgi:hypothetical protein